MPYAVISDIHSNIEALDVVIKHILSQSIKEIYCLGDIIGYGASPKECCNIVKKYCSAGAIFGNHDAVIIQAYLVSVERSLTKRILNYFHGKKKDEEKKYEIIELEHPWVDRVLSFTEQKLSAKQKSFLASLPMTLTKNDLFFTHQNPSADAFNPGQSSTIYFRRSLSYIFDISGYFQEMPMMETSEGVNLSFLNRLHEDQAVFALDYLRENNAKICFMGHTHAASCFYKKEKDRKCNTVFVTYNLPEEHSGNASFEFEMKEGYNYIINPGSVGQPRDNDSRASYILVDGKKIIWHRVPYDMEKASNKIKDAGLPAYYADRLLKGI